MLTGRGDKLRDRLEPLKDQVDAIVVKCLAKGVVSDELVALLSDVFPHTPWFISSKLGTKAAWLTKLKPETLRLLFLPPIPLGNLEDVAEWRAANRRPSREAIDYLEKCRRDYRKFLVRQGSAIVAMPTGLSLLALLLRSLSFLDEGDIVTKYVSKFGDTLETMTPRIGKASVFFASLVANMLFNPTTSDALEECDPFALGLRRAVDRTIAWRRNEEQRLGAEPPQNSEAAYGPDLLQGGEEQLKGRYSIDPTPWAECTRHWKQSQSGLGIVYDEPGLYRFDVWRGMSIVDGYVALTAMRRRAVSRLYRLVQSFAKAQPRPERQVSCLLLDAPGRGKSLLVRKVAKRLDIEYRSINITQVVDRADLLGQLDAVVTGQTEAPQRAFLVFVDEIDSPLGDALWHVEFLAPLEDGYYIRGGNRFHIRPCVWVFAGSRGAEASEDAGPPKKFKDFESRLTHGTIRLSSPDGCRRDAGEAATARATDPERLERVYIGVSMLRDRFPDLKSVSVGVLAAFYRIDPRVGIRRIRHFVDGVQNVQDKIVCMRNVSSIEQFFGTDEVSPKTTFEDLGYGDLHPQPDDPVLIQDH